MVAEEIDASENDESVTHRVTVSTLPSTVSLMEHDRAELHDKILLPTLSNNDQQRAEILRTEKAEAVLDYFRQFENASRAHVVLELW